MPTCSRLTLQTPSRAASCHTGLAVTLPSGGFVERSHLPKRCWAPEQMEIVQRSPAGTNTHTHAVVLSSPKLLKLNTAALSCLLQSEEELPASSEPNKHFLTVGKYDECKLRKQKQGCRGGRRAPRERQLPPTHLPLCRQLTDPLLLLKEGKWTHRQHNTSPS